MEISILRALNEISLLNKRIDKSLERFNITQFLNISVGEKPPVGYKSTQECKEEIMSKYQSLTSLIDRRSKIKSAIVSSNASTMVTIVGETMTVASAIELKKSILLQKTFLEQLRQCSASINKKVEEHNNTIEKALEETIRQLVGGKSSKINADEYSALAIPFRKDRLAVIIDPLNIKKVIEEKEEYINEFERTVDNILTESNATTKIQIPD